MVVLVAGGILTACGSQTQPTTTATARLESTSTPLPTLTPTPAPTDTPRPTNTPTPTVEPTLALGEVQSVDEGGFSFQPPLNYAVHIQGNYVYLSDKAWTEEERTIIIYLKGVTSNQGDESPGGMIDEFLRKFADGTGGEFIKEISHTVTIDGIEGLAFDLTGTLEGSPLRGQTVIVMPSPKQLLFGLGIANTGREKKRWENEGNKAFSAVLNSIEFSTAKSTGPCSISRDELLTNLESLIPYEESEINYTNFSGVGVSSLNVWYVDPTLDPDAIGEGIEKNAALATQSAASLSYSLATSEPCIAKLFEDGINPIVVDRNYNGWFSGLLELSSIPTDESLSEDELKALENAFQVQYLRTIPSEPTASAPNGSCTWPEAREDILWHFSSEEPNTSFYLVRDEAGVTIHAQWVVPTEYGDRVAFGYSIACIQNVLYEIPCLHPPADLLMAIGVDKNGELVFLGRLPGEGIREQDVGKTEVLLP